MRHRLPSLLLVLSVISLVACGGPIAEFWRPISEPNLLLPLNKGQTKLDFDLSQCRCGIYPTNVTHQEIVEFQPDKQRLAETGVVITPDEDGDCQVKPSLIVTECMRQRGWEPTNCAGRLPFPGGGSLCTSYVINTDP
jgi:hypothetical protein